MKIFTDKAGNSLHLTQKYIYATNNKNETVTVNGLKTVMKEAKNDGKINYETLKVKKIDNKKFMKLPKIKGVKDNA